MCSFQMDHNNGSSSNNSNYRGGGGYLTDIIRGGTAYGAFVESDFATTTTNWEFPAIDEEENLYHVMDNISFGDPFSNMRDPLLQELDVTACYTSPDHTNLNNFSGASCISNSRNINHDDLIISQQTKLVFDQDSNINITPTTSTAPTNTIPTTTSSPCNIFSRIQISNQDHHIKLPISPCESPVNISGSATATSPARFTAFSGELVSTNNSPKGCLIDQNTTMPRQILSPRSLGIKRRKGQAKKVVCIPAPAAANSRPSGEVVPSDLWAWRKYGQKPIKGSPYPRGYYRCSSSKGCSARKQVERSRTDPNMLVITYTSEHNHPWPTQRNALAGSTRSQPPKNNNNNNNNASKTTSTMQKTTSSNNTREDHQETEQTSNDTTNNNIVVGSGSSTTTATTPVKEEIVNEEANINDDVNHQFSSSYTPALMELQDHQMNDTPLDQGFFAELEEIEVDPLELLFSNSATTGTQRFDSELVGGGQEHKLNKIGEDLKPFNMFDWPQEDHDTNSKSSC